MFFLKDIIVFKSNWVLRSPIDQPQVHLSRSGSRFDPRLGQVSWVRFFRGFSSPVKQILGSFRPPRSPNIIWPSLSSSLIIHYGCQWPEMLMRPTTLNVHVGYQPRVNKIIWCIAGFTVKTHSARKACSYRNTAMPPVLSCWRATLVSNLTN